MILEYRSVPGIIMDGSLRGVSSRSNCVRGESVASLEECLLHCPGVS